MSAGRLEGIRVLCTRPRERAEELCFLLEDEGAEVLTLPLLEFQPPDDARPLRSAAELLHRYQWVLFTSAAGVQAMHEAAREAGTLERLGRARIGVVGPGTGKAARELGLFPEVEAEQTTGEGLAQSVKGKLSAGDEVLLPVAQQGRTELYEALLKEGLEVTRVAAYRTEATGREDPTWAEVRRAPPHLILFGSPRTAEAFLQSAGEDGAQLLGKMKRVAIGPTTASALERMGFAASAVAERPTAEGLVDAAIRAVQG